MHIANIPLSGGPSGKQVPKRIVIHAMAEYLDLDPVDMHAVDFLRERGYSPHACITPSGVAIKCRDVDRPGWHAKGFNVESLGVEFLVPGVHTYETFLEAIKHPYLSPIQYQTGVTLVREWLNIGALKIDRHSDLSPGRKHDPGDGFPWEEFIQDVTGGFGNG